MSPVASAMIVFSILFPAKGWVAPNQPLNINVQCSTPITLVLTDFTGKPMDPKGEANLQSSQTVDLKHIFDEVSTPGTFVLFALPKTADSATEKDITKFVGTPLVIDVREDLRREAPPGPMITRIVPMQYAVIATDKGEMTCSFYYDVAPETVGNFISLAMDGFYDGLNFFRVVPGMLIQTGDPRGDGTGGPGYRIEQEFNDRQHTEGVLSMARQTDPIEKQGAMPRAEAANSAGSQFLICLDYNNTKQLDRRYTAFARVVSGLDVLHAIGASPVGGPTGDVPQTPQMIQKVQVLPVLPGKNPYGETLSFAKPVVMPSAPPTTLPAR